MISVRPKIAELTFQLFGRSLHPELFQFNRTRRIQRDAFTADISITNSGHVITWRGNDVVLSEVAASSQQLLPSRRRLMQHGLHGNQSDVIQYHEGVTYQTTFSLEPVTPDMFWAIQKQLTSEATEGLLHRFDSNGRIAMGAISYIHIETRARSMLVQAIHTFPDDQAIVKIESSFGISEV